MERQLPKAILFSSLYFQQPANFSTAPHPRQRVQEARRQVRWHMRSRHQSSVSLSLGIQRGFIEI